MLVNQFLHNAQIIMGDEQASCSEGLLQSSTPRVPLVLLQRMEETIPVMRESMVSVVSRRESYHVTVWIDIANGRKSIQGSLC
jgi:hypothetical protein